MEYIVRGYSLQSRTGAVGCRRVHLLTVLSPVAIPTREEKVEGIQGPEAEIKPYSQRNEQQTQISLTR